MPASTTGSGSRRARSSSAPRSSATSIHYYTLAHYCLPWLRAARGAIVRKHDPKMPLFFNSGHMRRGLLQPLFRLLHASGARVFSDRRLGATSIPAQRALCRSAGHPVPRHDGQVPHPLGRGGRLQEARGADAGCARANLPISRSRSFPATTGSAPSRCSRLPEADRRRLGRSQDGYDLPAQGRARDHKASAGPEPRHRAPAACDACAARPVPQRPMSSRSRT